MNIVADADIAFVQEAFSEFGAVELLPGRRITRETVQDAAVLLVRSVTRVDRALLDTTAVRFVGTATIGIDHVDTDYLAHQAIGFASAPGSNADSVADYVTAALVQLAESKRLELQSMTIGIIGVGNVGSRVMARAEALGMRCLCCDPPKQRMTGSGMYLPLGNVLEEADIVTLHVPLTADGEDATVRMADERFLRRMKENAILINSSRGGVIDEAALRRYRGRLGGFVADVWEGEPMINLDTLRCADIATPHIAGYSFEGKVRGTAMIHEAACAFFFHAPVWRAVRYLGKRPAGRIDVSGAKKPVYKAVMTAYPIMEDDGRMRMIADTPAEKRGEYFDALRRSYPKRREFSHYTVMCDRKHQADADVLKRLGFSVQVK